MSKDGNLPHIETQFDLSMGPGVTLTGEMLWDYSQVRPPNGPKLCVKLATILSLSETLQLKGVNKMTEDEKVGDAALEKLRNTVAEEHKDQMNEKDRELLRIKTENEKLRKEQTNIETKILNPDEATIKSSAEN